MIYFKCLTYQHIAHLKIHLKDLSKFDLKVLNINTFSCFHISIRLSKSYSYIFPKKTIGDAG